MRNLNARQARNAIRAAQVNPFTTVHEAAAAENIFGEPLNLVAPGTVCHCAECESLREDFREQQAADARGLGADYLDAAQR